MSHDFTGQTALITGASRGIGRAIATTLGNLGADVIGTATTPAGAKAISEFFQSAGIRGQGLVLDVADRAAVEDFAESLQAQKVIPLILVNNAAITRDNLMLRMKDAEWEDVINTNLNSVYRMSKLCLRGMVKARHGRIVNITSVVALSGNAGQTNYTAAKAGIIGFTRSLAKEVGSRNITVNAIAPGFIQTDMTDAVSSEQQQMMLDQIALGRLGTTSDVAEAVVFLASPAAAYITGETLNINGGLYMA